MNLKGRSSVDIFWQDDCLSRKIKYQAFKILSKRPPKKIFKKLGRLLRFFDQSAMIQSLWEAYQSNIILTAKWAGGGPI
jgi:hypothetical protein